MNSPIERAVLKILEKITRRALSGKFQSSPAFQPKEKLKLQIYYFNQLY